MKILLSALLLIGSTAFACPDFSGTYKADYVPQDSRDTYTTTWRQTDCSRVDGTDIIQDKGASSPFTADWNFKIAAAPADNVWYWDGSQLEYLAKNANTEHCDIRDVYHQDEKKNLVYRWRFECPNQQPSPWYTDNTVNGTYIRQ
ncbi:MAG: hypothetical protein ACXWPM_12390 [Bdellovibrionota bacterium]